MASYFTEVQCISLLYPVEQAVYNRPQPADKTRSKEGKDTVEAYQLAQRLQSMVCFGEGCGGGAEQQKTFSMKVVSIFIFKLGHLRKFLLLFSLLFH